MSRTFRLSFLGFQETMLISRRLFSVTSKQLEKHRARVGSCKNEMSLNQQWIERLCEHLRNAYREKFCTQQTQYL